MEEKSIDYISSSMSTSTTSTSSINSRKTSNFFPQFNHPSSYNGPGQGYSLNQSKSHSISQIPGSASNISNSIPANIPNSSMGRPGTSANTTPYLSQGGPRMLSAPLTPVLHGSNKSTPLFNDYEFGQLDSSIWNNSLATPSSNYSNRPQSFPQATPPTMFANIQPEEARNFSEGLNLGQNLKLNLFQFQFDDLHDSNQNYNLHTSNGYGVDPSGYSNSYPGSQFPPSFPSSTPHDLLNHNEMFNDFNQFNLDNDISDPTTDEDLLNQSVNVALDFGNIDSPHASNSLGKSYKTTVGNITIDIPKAEDHDSGPNSKVPMFQKMPSLTIEKYPEVFSSSFYRRNENGYMFIKETNDELIRVNQLSNQPESEVTIDLQLNINDFAKLVTVNVGQLYNMELFNDIKIIKRKSNVLKRFRM